jgi:hypothetical protein
MSDAVKASDSIIEGLLGEALTQAAKAELIALCPYLELPVIKQVFFFFFDKYAEILIHKVAIISAFKVIDYETNKELQEYDNAKTVLLESIKSEDPEKIQKAKDELKARLSTLIRIRP